MTIWEKKEVEKWRILESLGANYVLLSMKREKSFFASLSPDSPGSDPNSSHGCKGFIFSEFFLQTIKSFTHSLKQSGLNALPALTKHLNSYWTIKIQV